MKNKRTKPTKQSLLRELESIHNFLSEKNSPPGKTNQAEKRAEPQTETMPKDIPTPLPGQQSLFDDANDSTVGVSITLSDDNIDISSDEEIDITDELEGISENRENPFLPKHIREKLKQERDGLAKSQQNLMPSKHNSNMEVEVIIDEIISQYMPIIEADLRNRIREKFKNGTPPDKIFENIL